MSRKSTIEVRAARAFSLKNYPLAISHLSDLLDCVGENPQTLYMLALCHARQHDDEQALALARRALATDAHHLESLKLMARLLFLRDEHAEARVLVARALRIRDTRARRGGASRGWLASLLGRLRVDRPPPVRSASFAVDEDRQWLEWAEAYLSASPEPDDQAPR